MDLTSISFRKYLLISLILHAALLVIFTFGLPKINKIQPKQATISVDIVNIAKTTNIPPKTSIKKPIESSPKSNQKPLSIPSPSQNQHMTASNTISTAQIKKQGPEIKNRTAHTDLKKVDKPIQQKKTEIQQPQTQNDQVKKIDSKQVKSENPKQSQHPMKALKSIEKKNTTPVEKNILEDTFKELETLIDSESDQVSQQDLPMSASEIDAIRMQIKKSWNPIAFNGSGHTMKVTLLMYLDKNGIIINVKTILEKNSNPSYKAFVESVIRAAKKASPLQYLDQNKFQA